MILIRHVTHFKDLNPPVEIHSHATEIENDCLHVQQIMQLFPMIKVKCLQNFSLPFTCNFQYS